jgi:hypothetical protein
MQHLDCQRDTLTAANAKGHQTVRAKAEPPFSPSLACASRQQWNNPVSEDEGAAESS